MRFLEIPPNSTKLARDRAARRFSSCARASRFHPFPPFAGRSPQERSWRRGWPASLSTTPCGVTTYFLETRWRCPEPSAVPHDHPEAFTPGPPSVWLTRRWAGPYRSAHPPVLPHQRAWSAPGRTRLPLPLSSGLPAYSRCREPWKRCLTPTSHPSTFHCADRIIEVEEEPLLFSGPRQFSHQQPA